MAASLPEKRTTGADHSKQFFERMQKVKLHNFIDFTIRVKGQEIPCHRVILASQSDYFAALFDSGLKEAQTSEVTLDITEYELLKNVIDFMYSGEILLSSNNVINYLEVCDFLLVKSLRHQCEKYIKETMTPTTCALWYHIACEFASNDVKNQVEQMIAADFHAVTNSKTFTSLTPDERTAITSKFSPTLAMLDQYIEGEDEVQDIQDADVVLDLWTLEDKKDEALGWDVKEDIPLEKRDYAMYSMFGYGMCAIPNGFVILEMFRKNAMIFNAITDSWTETDALAEELVQCPGLVYISGKVYTFGPAHKDEGSYDNTYNIMQSLNLKKKKKWRLLETDKNMPGPQLNIWNKGSHISMTAAGQLVFCFQTYGNNSNDYSIVLHSFDTQKETWKTYSADQMPADLQKMHIPYAEATEDHLYAINQGRETGISDTACFKFNFASETWSTFNNQVQHKHVWGLSAIYCGKIYLVGGSDGHLGHRDRGTRVVEVYDIENDIWEVHDTPLPKVIEDTTGCWFWMEPK